jgi:hypothetical protein
MTNYSAEACPKCGEREWWHKASFLSKNEKSIIMVSCCDHCHTYFKARFKLVHIVGRTFKSMKISEMTNARKPSAYNLFVAEALRDGKGISEAAKLWQKHKQMVKA